jgi:hypothetical protein
MDLFVSPVAKGLIRRSAIIGPLEFEVRVKVCAISPCECPVLSMMVCVVKVDDEIVEAYRLAAARNIGKIELDSL